MQAPTNTPSQWPKIQLSHEPSRRELIANAICDSLNKLKFDYKIYLDTDYIRFKFTQNIKSSHLSYLHMCAVQKSLQSLKINAILTSGKNETPDTVKVLNLDISILDTEEFEKLLIVNISNIRDIKNKVNSHLLATNNKKNIFQEALEID